MLDLEMADMRRSLQVMQDKLTSAESERDSISAQLEDMTAQKGYRKSGRIIVSCSQFFFRSQNLYYTMCGVY